MKTKYFTILSMSAICLWLGLWGYWKDCALIQNIAAITGLLDMTALETILIADRWRHTEQYVSNADKSYKLAHKNDNYLNKILQIGFVEKNVYTFTFILTSGLRSSLGCLFWMEIRKFVLCEKYRYGLSLSTDVWYVLHHSLYSGKFCSSKKN